MRARFLILFIIVIGFVTVSSQTVFSQDNIQISTLKVKVTYKGTGEVDSIHGIHLFLFDTPDFVKGEPVIPVGMNSTFKNGNVITFTALRAEKVYLTSAYGDLSLMGPPPSGTPVGMYGEMEPKAIVLDKEVVEIEFEFDDSFTMP